MTQPILRLVLIVFVVMMTACATAPSGAPNPLPSWNDGATRNRIISFVEAVTTEDGPGYVSPGDRIAVFDNDGTLWSEKPVYFQIFFALDQVYRLAPEHPEWQHDDLFQAAVEGDLGAFIDGGHEALAQLLAASHTGMTTDEFSEQVLEWVNSARHPVRDRPYTELVYQPMLELLDYLELNGFQTWIVSGGGQDFMRPWVEGVYGIPPERVVGTHVQLEYEVFDDGPVLVKLPEIALVDDKAGKPVGIHRFIGKRPIAAFGNSDGDFQMLEWTTAGEGERLGVFIHHTDAEREYAYDRESDVGRLVRGLDEADQRGWLIVDMARDWSVVYPP